MVDFDASDKYRSQGTTTKAIKFQADISSIPFEHSNNQYILVFELTSVQLPRASWGTPETGVKCNFPSRTFYWIHCLGKTNALNWSWQIWRCWKKQKSVKTALQQVINRLFFSCVGTLVQSLQIMFHFSSFASISTLPSTMMDERSIVIAKLVTICFLETVADVRSTVPPSSTTSRWYQSQYCSTPELVDSTRYMPHIFEFRQEKYWCSCCWCTLIYK